MVHLSDLKLEEVDERKERAFRHAENLLLIAFSSYLNHEEIDAAALELIEILSARINCHGRHG